MLAKYQKFQKPLAFSLAALWLLGYSFLIGKADQHQKDIKRIESAYRACDAIQSQNQSADRSIISNSPCGPRPDDTNNETENITLFGLKLSEALLIIVTGLLWISTKDLVSSADQTASRQLRAYISVEPGASLPQNKRRGTVFEFRPIVVNNGLTPANDVRIWSLLEIAPPTIPSNFNYTIAPPLGYSGGSVTTIGPRQNRFHSRLINRRLTITELKSLLKGKTCVHIWGFVQYRDIFDHPQHTNFSYVVFISTKRGQAVWNSTEHHNDGS
jgi:hypothetical protein